MTTPTASIHLEPRTVTGKKVKTLRRAGIVPVHLYGPGLPSRNLQSPARPLLQAISRAGGEFGHPLQITIAGEPDHHYRAVASAIQWEPRTGDVLHVDFRTLPE